jgi:hypothetical protein
MLVTFSALETFPAQLAQLFGDFPAHYRNWSPASWEGIPSESFSAIEQICHLRDIEIEGYHVRLQRMLEEENPTLPSIDGYVLAEKFRYSEADPAEVLESIRTARGQTMKLIRNLTKDQFRRTGFFGNDQITVKGLIHYLCSHDQQHLSGMQWLLGKLEAAAADPD